MLDDLVRDVEGGLLGSTGPRFFGWVIGGALPAALAADWLVSAWDQNACIYPTSPACAVIEEVAGAWLLDVLGLPADASVAFVTGTQSAHLTALAVARSHLLAARGHDVDQHGLHGAAPLRVLAGGAHHASLDRAVRLLGLGATPSSWCRRTATGGSIRPRSQPRRSTSGRRWSAWRPATSTPARSTTSTPASTPRTPEGRGCTSTARSACGRPPARGSGT